MSQSEHEVLAEILERSKTHLAMRARIAREDVNEFCELVLKDEETGKPIEQAPIHERWHQLCEGSKRLVLWSHTEAGKCLAPDTAILRANGSTILAKDVSAGDRVMGPGGPRTVLSTTSGTDEMFRIVPNKGDAWECNSVHVLTLVHTTTGEIIDIPLDEYLKKSGYWKHLYKLFRSHVECFDGEATLSVDPYFLGVWFGDGTKRVENDKLRGVAVSKPDAEIADCVRATAISWGLEFTTSTNPDKCPTYRISSSAPGRNNPLLDAMRDLVGHDIAIPQALLTAPWDTRANFLAGYIDTDGEAGNSGAEITQKREDWARAIVRIARSLGLSTSIKPRTVAGYGIYWRVRMQGDFSRIPIRIARKCPTTEKSGTGKNPLRTGFKVEPVGRGKYAGFTLDGDGRFLLDDFTVTHNTSQICIGRTLWLLGRNPKMRIAVISNTREQASKIILAVGKYIAESKELRLVFPHLKPGELWRANAISIERTNVSKDPSLQAFGVHGAVVGARIDHLILDDVLDFENCQTPRARQDLFDWYRSTVASRLTKDATVIAIGTPWHPEDLYHRLEANALYQSHRFPVLNVEGESTWLDRWPLARIAQERIERGPLEFARTMMCEARDESDARFKREYIDKALSAGDSWPVIHRLTEDIVAEEMAAYHASVTRLGGDSGYACFSGVDMAVQKHAAADYTAISTIMVMPNQDRRLLCVEAGRWSGPEIVDRIIDTHERYNSIVTVENNAAQDFILQFTRDTSAVPVQPFTTGRNKLHPEFGVESLAAEFANDKWVLPNEGGKLDPEVEKLITEMLYYQPDAHTGDRLMSLWLAREGARRNSRRSDGVGVRIFGKSKPKLALVR